jgi:hypothetical protein
MLFSPGISLIPGNPLAPQVTTDDWKSRTQSIGLEAFCGSTAEMGMNSSLASQTALPTANPAKIDLSDIRPRKSIYRKPAYA